MTVKSLLLAATAMVAIGMSSVSAQPVGPGPNDDPEGYYSQSDTNGYYDRDGHYQRFDDRGPPPDDRGPPPDMGPPRDGPPPGYYRESDGGNCHRDNAVAGTILGGIAGGLIGGAVSHGHGGAVVGGVLAGGLLGNVIAGDVECDDQPAAFKVYSEGLNGNLGQRYEWHSPRGRAYGYFTPTREYRRHGMICRDFTAVTYRRDKGVTRNGTACRDRDGEWKFD